MITVTLDASKQISLNGKTYIGKSEVCRAIGIKNDAYFDAVIQANRIGSVDSKTISEIRDMDIRRGNVGEDFYFSDYEVNVIAAAFLMPDPENYRPV